MGKLSRWRRLSILAALILAGCPTWPDIPEGCRNFAMTSWGGGAPWDELDWTKIRHVDEPMAAIWGWKGDLASKADVCGPIGLEMVRARIYAARGEGITTWLNWSTEELQAVGQLCGAEEIGAGADVVSFDSYGGKWDFYLGKTPDMLDFVLDHLAPGQQMGLVPEGHYCPDCGVTWDENELMWTNAAYLEWAMGADSGGRIFAVAPFIWGHFEPPNKSIADQPRLAAFLADFAATRPRCAE